MMRRAALIAASCALLGAGSVYGTVLPPEFPDQWSSDLTMSLDIVFSHPGGVNTQSDTFDGQVWWDATSGRLRWSEHSPSSGDEITTVIWHADDGGSQAEQVQMQFTTLQGGVPPANPSCSMTSSTGTPQTCFMGKALHCLPESQSCSTDCRLTGLFNRVGGQGPPVVCFSVPEAGAARDVALGSLPLWATTDTDFWAEAPTAALVVCGTQSSVSREMTAMHLDGRPAGVATSFCNPGPQSLFCVTSRLMFTNVQVGAQHVPEAVFHHPGMDSCLAGPIACSTFCGQHGTCPTPQRRLLGGGRMLSDALPGSCSCDQGWDGQRCNEPQCALNEVWSAWSACDAPCGGGRQRRTKTYVVDPSSPAVCEAPDTVVEEERACNAQACGAPLMCPHCAGQSSGPCRHAAEHDATCFNFYAGTTICPAGTVKCVATCPQCAHNTFGPCVHDNDQSCHAYIAGTYTCPAGTTSCATSHIPPGGGGGGGSGSGSSSGSSGTCEPSSCWPGTSGSCVNPANGVCYSGLLGGPAGCPAGTLPCASVSSAHTVSLAGSNVAVLDVQLVGTGVSGMGPFEKAAFVAAVAEVAGLSAASVGIDTISAGATVAAGGRRQLTGGDGDALFVPFAARAAAPAQATPSANVGFLIVTSDADGAAAAVAGASANGKLAAALRKEGVSRVQTTSMNRDPEIIGRDGRRSGSNTRTSVGGAEPEEGMGLVAIIAIGAGVVIAGAAAAAVVVRSRRDPKRTTGLSHQHSFGGWAGADSARSARSGSPVGSFRGRIMNVQPVTVVMPAGASAGGATLGSFAEERPQLPREVSPASSASRARAAW